VGGEGPWDRARFGRGSRMPPLPSMLSSSRRDPSATSDGQRDDVAVGEGWPLC
jgi:hypothetical protein